jgi:hypothetical protein
LVREEPVVGEHLASGLDVGVVDVHALVHNSGCPVGLGLLERGDHSFVELHLEPRRAEHVVRHFDMRRMDEHLATEAEVAVLLREFPRPFRVSQVLPHPHQRELQPRCTSREHGPTAEV